MGHALGRHTLRVRTVGESSLRRSCTQSHKTSLGRKSPCHAKGRAENSLTTEPQTRTDHEALQVTAPLIDNFAMASQGLHQATSSIWAASRTDVTISSIWSVDIGVDRHS